MKSRNKVKKCYFCKKNGFQAEKFFAVPHVPGKSICFQCGISIYLMIKAISEKKGAITGKLENKVE